MTCYLIYQLGETTMPCEEIAVPFTQYKTGRIIRKGGFWCSSLSEAQNQAAKKAFPYVCFVYEDGSKDHPFRAIPGWGCAHYVAHQLGIKIGSSYETCRKGFSVQIGQLKQGRTQLGLQWARNDDIWISEDGGHSGLVIAVDKSAPRVRIRACGLSGNKYEKWMYNGTVWQRTTIDYLTG